ncbi:Gfo/Idh/MocA family protein [Amorphus sp. 3PC139-8]|uniref:Gfo/Idh/MocA family protein n=1 Tax=Amorphus sp. 3PC139-8 TaxID=2735676 RepID=UPI00345DA4F7
MVDQNLLLMGAAHAHTGDHLRVAAEEGWRIAAVHERDADRRAAICRSEGATAVADPDEALSLGVNAAIVCSETAYHEDDALAAFASGLPVFCEKPLGIRTEAARNMNEAARNAGLLLDTAFFLRTNFALNALRDRVLEGAIGQVVEARMRFSHDGGYADWLDLSGWMTDPALAGFGGFADEAVHAIDWLQWTLGPIETGRAHLGNVLGWPVDDHGAAVFGFANGATATVQAGWTDTRLRLELDLVGSEGAAALADGRVRMWHRGSSDLIWSADLSPLDAGEGIRQFFAALGRGSGRALVPPEEAVAVNEVLDLLREG